jgi:hypothetical protein
VDDLGRINVGEYGHRGVDRRCVLLAVPPTKEPISALAICRTLLVGPISRRSASTRVGPCTCFGSTTRSMTRLSPVARYRSQPSGPRNVQTAPGSLLGGVPYLAVSRDGYINLVSGDGRGISFVWSSNGGAGLTYSPMTSAAFVSRSGSSAGCRRGRPSRCRAGAGQKVRGLPAVETSRKHFPRHLTL